MIDNIMLVIFVSIVSGCTYKMWCDIAKIRSHVDEINENVNKIGVMIAAEFDRRRQET